MARSLQVFGRPTALAALALCIAMVSIARPSSAAWPKPAAGPSASGQPEVLFTFDDGPHHVYSKRLLDVLRDHGIQAIFFWVGHRASRNSKTLPKRLAMIDRAVKEGHLIGTHTVNHVHLCAIPAAKGAREIDTAIELYERLTKLPMILFRAPYGDHCPRAEKLLAERGIKNFHWDIDPREWKHLDSEITAEYIIGKLRRLDGRAVILIHDTKAAAAKSVPKVLAWIKRENQKREKRAGRKPIRVLDASDVILETIDVRARRWLASVAWDGSSLLAKHLSTLMPGYAPRMWSSRQPHL